MKARHTSSLPFPALAAGLLAASIAMAADESPDSLKPFPQAEEGYQRHVIHLPELKNEAEHKVELLLGKTIQLDERNQYFMMGNLTRETVQGWGYSYYRLESDGSMGGTLMAVPDDAPKVDRFVQVRGEDALLRYNSKLPVVVYVPDGFEVKYRVWTAGEVVDVPAE